MVFGQKTPHVSFIDRYLSFLWLRSRYKGALSSFKKDGERRLEPKDIERFNLLTYGTLVGISLIFRSPSFTLGVVIGGAIMALNLYLTKKIIKGFFGQKKVKNVIQYFIKFFGVLGLVVFILFFLQKWVSPLGLGMGMLSTPLTVGLYGFKNLKSLKTQQQRER